MSRLVQFLRCALTVLPIVFLLGCNETSILKSDQTIEVAPNKSRYFEIVIGDNTDGSYYFHIDFFHTTGPAADVALLNKKLFNAYQESKSLRKFAYQEKNNVWPNQMESFSKEVQVESGSRYFLVIHNTGQSALTCRADASVSWRKD